MNIKKYFIAIALFISGFIYAQQEEHKKPDYDIIKKNIENKDSDFYYDKLLKRLQENDTLLTHDEYLHLYYGATLQKDYQPYGYSPYDKELRTYYNKENLDQKDYQPFIELANKSLKEYPLDLRLIHFLSYVHYLNGDEIMDKKVSANFQGLMRAILSTGDGLTCETGIHVLWVNHEYIILNLFDLESRGQSLVGNCDYLRFEKDKYKIPGMYFNVSKLFEKSAEMFRK